MPAGSGFYTAPVSNLSRMQLRELKGTIDSAMRRKGEALVEPEELSVEPCTFYGAVGHALAAWFALERLRLGVAPPTELLEPQAQEEPPPHLSGSLAGKGDGRQALHRREAL